MCTQVDAGYFAEDGSGNSVNTAAVDQEALSRALSLQPEPQRAQQRSRDTTVDANGGRPDPWQGAVAEQAGEGSRPER